MRLRSARRLISLLVVSASLLFSAFQYYLLCSSAGTISDSPAAVIRATEASSELTASWLKEALNQGLPPAAGEGRETYSSRGLTDKWLTSVAELKDPRGLITGELGWLAALELNRPLYPLPVTSSSGVLLESGAGIEEEEGEYYFEETAAPENDILPLPPADSLPLVALYNTHNAEAYSPTYGQAKVEGENAGVFRVAQHLREVLQLNYHIPVVQSEKLHDYPEFNKSYINSAQTVRSLVKSYPGLKMLLDIHRDSIPSDDPQTIELNGKKTAKILIVVGTGQRLSHPNWQLNLELAQNLAHHLEAVSPGLCRGVRLKPGNYNQQLHPGCLLIEVGNSNNTLEEAENAVEYLAEAISRCLQH
mgnify:CR=1 FL=1